MKARTIMNLVGIAMDIPTKDVEKVQKYAPEALCKKDEDGNEIFKVVVSEGEGCFGIQSLGCLSEVGANFIDVDGTPYIWMGIPSEKISVKEEFVKEKYGMSLAALQKVENQVKAALTDVNKTIDGVTESIKNIEI